MVQNTARKSGDQFSAPFTWNQAQAAVIAAPADARLVVDAGPGTGKTATAAGRIAALVDGGLPPKQLWTISFSRAAVGEMRSRLLAFGGPDAALGRVTTLDSLAWYLRAEDSDDGMVLEGHDRAIEETLLSLRARDPQMLRRIETIAHFTIDETQDLVAARAALVVEILAALSPACGVTLLTDEAQAIYGFSASALAASFTADTVARHVLEMPDTKFQLHRLTEVHRTFDPKLLRLFRTARGRALHSAANPKTKLVRMRRSVAWQAHGKVRDADAQTLVLYRSRAEVLAAAQDRIDRAQPFRLRLSGLPIMLHPWIAEILGDYDSSVLPRWQFEDLWQSRSGDDGADAAWTILTQAIGEAGAERIAMPRLLAVLRTSHPPSELCRFDPGDSAGPVIGTIHASKGREMDRVQLMLPREASGRDDPDAEARVLFVAATRAKRRLEIGKGLRLASRRLARGRVFVPTSDTAARIEIGRPGDFTWAPSADLPLRPGQKLDLAFMDGTLIVSHAGNCLGTATSSLMADLRDIRAQLAGGQDYRAFVADMQGLALLGVYTEAQSDPPPRKTGLTLAPAVNGLVRCNFRPA